MTRTDLFDGFLNRFTGFTGTLLDTAQQFVMFAFHILKIIIREFSPLLLQLAFRDVPVPFDFKFGHNNPSFFVMFAVEMTANVFVSLSRFT
jgi:hypothetical protein